jgi:hypothetical protein
MGIIRLVTVSTGEKNGRSLLLGLGNLIEDIGGLLLGLLVVIVEGTLGAGHILIESIKQEILGDIMTAAGLLIRLVLLVDVVIALLDSPVQLLLCLH